MPNHPYLFIEKDTFTSVPVNTNYRQTNESSSELIGSFLIATTENNRIDCIQGLLTPKIKSWFFGLSVYEAKEELYVTAIDNLLKKIEYLHLTMQLDQDLITEDEFDEELENNEDNYLIKMNSNFNDIDFSIVQSIIHKLKRNKFSSDEISEMFSISIKSVEEFVDCNPKNVIL